MFTPLQSGTNYYTLKRFSFLHSFLLYLFRNNVAYIPRYVMLKLFLFIGINKRRKGSVKVMSELVTRAIDDLGRIVIAKDIRKELGLKEGDKLEMEIINGEIILRKPLVIEVLPIIGLSLQKVIEDGKDFDIIEIFEEQGVGGYKFYVFVYKCYRGGRISSIDSNANIEEQLMKESVRDYIREGYVII